MPIPYTDFYQTRYDGCTPTAMARISETLQREKPALRLHPVLAAAHLRIPVDPTARTLFLNRCGAFLCYDAKQSTFERLAALSPLPLITDLSGA